MLEHNEDDIQTKKTSNSPISKFVRGSTMLFAGRLFSLLLKTLIQLVMVRYLTKEDFGAFSYALNWVDSILVLSLVALDSAASRFVPIYDEENDQRSILGLVILSLGTITGVSGSIVVLFLGFRSLLLGNLISDPLSLSMLSILIFLAPFQAIDNWIQSMFAAYSKVKAIFFRRYILWPGIRFGTILFVIFMRASVLWLAIGFLIGGVVTTTIYLSMLFSLLRQKGLFYNFTWRKPLIKASEIFGFSIPMFFTGIVLILRSNLAVILLEKFSGTVAVAEYRAVEPIAKLNAVMYDSFILLYLPLASRMFAQKDTKGINDLFWRTSSLIAIVTLPIFFLTFSLAKPLTPLLLGKDYTDSYLVMLIMAFGSYVNTVMGFNKGSLRAYNKILYLFVVDVIVLIIALTSFFLLIPRYGALGGAIAFTAALIANNLLYHYGLVRYIGVDVINTTYAGIYFLIIVSAAGLFALQLIVNPPFIISFIAAAITALAILRLSVKKLQVAEIFPELLKIPFANYFLT